MNYCNQAIPNLKIMTLMTIELRVSPQIHSNNTLQSNTANCQERTNLISTTLKGYHGNCTLWFVPVCLQPWGLQNPASQTGLYLPASLPQIPHGDQAASKDTRVKISLVTKEVNKLGAIVKVACRQGVQMAFHLLEKNEY
jgi:hypothetical protein